MTTENVYTKERRQRTWEIYKEFIKWEMDKEFPDLRDDRLKEHYDRADRISITFDRCDEKRSSRGKI